MLKRLLTRCIQSFRQTHNDTSGISLVETVIALGILAIVAGAYLMGMSATSKAVMVSQQRVTAENLAKSQMEYVQSLPYDTVDNPPLYSPTTMSLEDIQNGYDVDIQAERVNPLEGGTGVDVGLQKLTVLIYRSGAEVFRLQGYRWNGVAQ